MAILAIFATITVFCHADLEEGYVVLYVCFATLVNDYLLTNSNS